MPPAESPQFPITVRWEDEECDVLTDMKDLETQLEWFDSENTGGEKVEVTDALGRRVILKVENVEAVIFRLA